ncbi:YwiC-like family protein [Pseudanabaena sp. Chao 1811]|uniref:YwiC-like family protein n=1 Tax=Pseudanabaena sp. Chao 1811 TaxID=2963092 RepID=UPI0022F3F55A|nr:YwiC-like family protein [Pseudanabaena sp. Chao 1811]
MTISPTNSNSADAVSLSEPTHNSHSHWYRLTFSPEHGVYIVLFGSFLTGAALAQQWTLNTTLALICTFAGFQAEHPLVLQIRQRRSWKPRFLVWGGIYGGISLGIAIYLYLQTPVLLWLYLGAIATLVIDAIAVFYRQQKAIANEILTFAAVCLAAPFANAVASDTITISVLGLWLLNTLFFSSAIFTVKLRKPKTASLMPSLIYHAIASFVIAGLWYYDWLNAFSALAFGVALLKFGLILGLREWYQTTRIQNVAIVETISAIIFVVIVSISLLPAHL